jgi:hypothetical protein
MSHHHVKVFSLWAPAVQEVCWHKLANLGAEIVVPFHIQARWWNDCRHASQVSTNPVWIAHAKLFPSSVQFLFVFYHTRQPRTESKMITLLDAFQRFEIFAKKKKKGLPVVDGYKDKTVYSAHKLGFVDATLGADVDNAAQIIQSDNLLPPEFLLQKTKAPIW